MVFLKLCDVNKYLENILPWVYQIIGMSHLNVCHQLPANVITKFFPYSCNRIQGSQVLRPVLLRYILYQLLKMGIKSFQVINYPCTKFRPNPSCGFCLKELKTSIQTFSLIIRVLVDRWIYIILNRYGLFIDRVQNRIYFYDFFLLLFLPQYSQGNKKILQKPRMSPIKS